MIKEHELRTDITAEHLQMIFRKNGLDFLLQDGKLNPSEVFGETAFQKLGIQLESLSSIVGGFKEVIIFLKRIGTSNPEIEKFTYDLEQIMAGYEQLWNLNAAKSLMQHFVDQTKEGEFFKTVNNACFLIYLKKHLHSFEGNQVAGLIIELLKHCKEWYGKQYAWLYTKNELRNCLSLTMNGKGRGRRYSIHLGDDLMALLLKKQAAMDPLVNLLLQFTTIDESQIRKDIHNQIQSGLKTVLSEDLPSFGASWSYYFKSNSPKGEVNRNIYSLYEPFYQLPEDWQSFEKASKGRVSSPRDFYDALQKRINRCFKKSKTK